MPRSKNIETSLVEVARKASVSLGTVSRVMNGLTNVNPDLRRQVMLASRELGFVPKLRRRHLAILTDYQASILPVGYVSMMTSLISRFAVEQHFGVELIDLENLDSAYDCHIDGAIGVVFDDRILQLKEVPNLPIVVINHPLADKGLHSLYTDHKEQGALATAHLIDHGHRKIAFLAIQSQEWGADQRLRGYQAELKKAGLRLDPSLVRYSRDEPLYDILQRWVRNGVTAILNFNEDLALEVLHILSNVFNLKIGHQISTITLEDLPIYQYFSPSQTVIRQPLDKLAELAVTHIAEASAALQAGEAPGLVLDHCMHGELIERDSVARLNGAHTA